MITELIINDTERPTRLSFAPQALSMAPDDLLDHLAGVPRASVVHPDEAVQAPAAATLSEVRRIQAAARRHLAVQRAELTARQIALIADHVGHVLRIDQEKLRGKSRGQHITFCRQVAMYICRQVNAASFPSIGALFGRNHSTVMATCQVIERRMAREAAFRIFMARLAWEISGAVPAPAEAA